MADFTSFDDLDNPLQALLNELADLDEVSRRRRVHETARDMVGLPHETFTAYRDALVAAGYVRSSDFTTTYREEQRRQQQAAREAGEEEEGRDPSQATQLIRTALEHYELGVTPDDKPFAVPRNGPRVPVMLSSRGGTLGHELSRQYFDEHGAPTNKAARDEALYLLCSQALQAEPVELHRRVARFDDGLIVDLGYKDARKGRVVKITPTGWHVLDSTPGPLFGRTKATQPLPEPARDGTLDDLRAALDVTDASWPLDAAALVHYLIPDISHVVELLRGPQGTGKSTRARRRVSLIDPSGAPLRKPPKDLHEWTVGAAGSWVVAIDNLSTVPEWLSDAMCRAVTGDGDVRRTLFTDDDLTVFSFRRCLILTSIDVGALAGDLADRLLAIDCAPITDEQRREDADLAAEWEQRYPRALGALYDLTARVLAVLPHVRPERLPRMADYARILAAVDDVLGTDGLTTYAEQAEDLADEVLEASSVAAALLTLMDDRDAWSGTASKLLATLTEIATRPDKTGRIPRLPAGWPPSARALSGQLTRLTDPLKKVHKITITRSRGGVRGRSRLVTLQGERDSPSAPSTPSATTSDQHERADANADAKSGADANADANAGAPSAPDTPSDLHEHPPADGADGADGESRLCGGLGSDALREPEDGHVASPAPEASADPNEPMDLAKMKAILLAEGARWRAAVNGDRLATYDQLPDEEP